MHTCKRSMTSIEELQNEIASWADDLHPARTPLSVICKLLEEMAELIASDKMGDPDELADIAILTLDLFHLQEVDLTQAVQTKMATNRERQWAISDNGRMQHVA